MTPANPNSDDRASPIMSDNEDTATIASPLIPQFDGPNDPRHKPNSFISNIITAAHAPPAPKVQAPPKPSPINAVQALLPYCTANGQLTNEQVIAISDVAGSLKELALLAVRASVDDGQKEILVNAVGDEAAEGIVDFFKDEWVADF